MRKPSRPPACNFFCVQRGAYQDSSPAAQNDNVGREGGRKYSLFPLEAGGSVGAG